MGHRVDKPINPVALGAHQFAILSAHRIDAVPGHRRAKHRGDIIGEKSGAIDQATRVDFSGCAHHAHAVAKWLELAHSRVGDDMRALACRHARVRLHQFLA